MSDQQRGKRNNYQKISQEIRLEIIDRILKKGQNIKEISQEKGVNISTCKAILKVYQQEGRVGKKPKRNKVHNVIQTFSFFCINDSNIEQLGNLKIQEYKLSLERHQDFDKHLEVTAKQKAEKMLDQLISDKKKSAQAAAEVQRQLMQIYMNNYCQFYTQMGPNMIPLTVRQPNMPSQLPGSHDNNPFNNVNI